MRSEPRTPRGFTIVELMIVVAIIGLLMALLMPALSSAMRNSRAAHDKVVIKGVGMATTNSSEDFKGQYIRPGLVARCHYVRRGGNVGVINKGYVPGRGLTGDPWDSSENLYSVLIMKEYLNPDACVSPVDENPLVGVKGEIAENTGEPIAYNYGVWDPGNPSNDVEVSPAAYFDTTFSCQLGDESPDNASYANQTLVGRRYKKWRGGSTTIVPLYSTRGTTDSNDTGSWASELTDGQMNLSADGVLQSSVIEHLGPTNVWQGHTYTSDGKVQVAEDFFRYKHYAGSAEQTNYAGTLPDNMFDCEFTTEWVWNESSGATAGHGADDNFLSFTNNNNAEAGGSWSTNDKFCFADGGESPPDGWRNMSDSVFLSGRPTFDYMEQ